MSKYYIIRSILLMSFSGCATRNPGRICKSSATSRRVGSSVGFISQSRARKHVAPHVQKVDEVRRILTEIRSPCVYLHGYACSSSHAYSLPVCARDDRMIRRLRTQTKSGFLAVSDHHLSMSSCCSLQKPVIFELGQQQIFHDLTREGW